MSSLENLAAWLLAAKVQPFEVKPAPVWTPGENEILVRNHAVAINPVDGTQQAHAWFPLEYPTILGQDVAGEVVLTGPSVTRFKKGDHVLGHAVGMSTGRKQDNAFQLYTILQTNMTSPIVHDMSYQRAAVLPLAISTAACGLFQDTHLDLQLPTEPAQRPTGKTLLIWGGASSVGSCAIQLAVAAGYEVITTASRKNFELVKTLGANQVFDYNSPTVVHDIIKAFKGKDAAGAMDCIGEGAWEVVQEIVSHIEGTKNVATTKSPFPDPPEGVTMRMVFGTTLKDNRVGKAIYEDFLPMALEAGTFVPAPDPLVVGEGLESIQKAINRQREGVSAQKVVVTL
ncbi:hypothetical protein MMC13_006095 [Lambiella insularis]|nr:hypothetical protein [Lambiella insularis]